MINAQALPRPQTLTILPESRALLRALLLCELSEQTAHAASCRTTTAELAGHADVQALFDREVTEASAERSEAVVNEIRHALLRLDDGSYGACEGCNRALPYERLKAIPYARRCIECCDLPIRPIG